MKMTHDQVFAFYPNVYLQFRFALAAFPVIFNMTGDSVVGNSSGFNEQALKASFGEYIERYHFYNNVRHHCISTLKEKNSLVVHDKLIKLINQLKCTRELAENHFFECCRVRNIFSGEEAYIPLVMISLAHGNSLDRKYIPFIDSCGQAAHIDPAKAFDSALNEFVERQALIGGWLSGKAKFQIALHAHAKFFDFNPVVDQLTRHGNLYGFEISHHLPGYSVMVVYFSNNKRDTVHYAVGMATDFSPETAIVRALNELWQSFIFMYLNAEDSEMLDHRFQYLNELIAFNSQETKQIIPFFSKSLEIIDVNDFMVMPSFDKADMIKLLKNISSDIFVYETNYLISGKKFYFCKILSPDCFLHMGIKMPLNLDNPYARLLNIDPAISIKHSIPFP